LANRPEATKLPKDEGVELIKDIQKAIVPKEEVKPEVKEQPLTEEARTYKTKDAFVLDMLEKDLRKPDIEKEKLQAGTEKLISMPEGKEKVAFANKLKKLSSTIKTKSLSAEDYSKIYEEANKPTQQPLISEDEQRTFNHFKQELGKGSDFEIMFIEKQIENKTPKNEIISGLIQRQIKDGIEPIDTISAEWLGRRIEEGETNFNKFAPKPTTKPLIEEAKGEVTKAQLEPKIDSRTQETLRRHRVENINSISDIEKSIINKEKEIKALKKIELESQDIEETFEAQKLIEQYTTEIKDDKWIIEGYSERVKSQAPIQKVAKVAPVKVEEATEDMRIEGKEVADAYETQKDIWIGTKDVRVLQSKNEAAKLQTDIKAALGKKTYSKDVQEYDKAIQLYIDTKRNPQNMIDYYKELSPEQKKIVDLAQDLPPKLQKIADRISESYNKMGLESQEADIIKNVLDNYVNRTWDLTDKQKTEIFRKFGTTTKHAKQRVLDTIIEGWSRGYKLKVEGATNSLQILKEEMIKTIEDKKFIKALQKLKTIDGESLLSSKQLEDFVRVEHPNFKMWKYAGEAVPDKVYGKNVFVDNEGNLFERQDLYAPKAQAKNLNNILGTSSLMKLPGVKAVTKYNATIKAWILQSSFFHHLAFMRSYYLGTNHKYWDEMSFRQAYRQGLDAIKQEKPVIMLGVKNGLTLGLKQDWNEKLINEEGIISNILAKTKVTKAISDKVMELRKAQADFLFSKLGAGLKAKAFMIEYRNLSKKHPNLSQDKVAKMVANLINDDFGGLHLQRLGRNPTIQHIFRLFALAPDWTESNVRSMAKAFKAGGKEETDLYRNFWAGIYTKGAIMTVLANAIMAGLDEDNTFVGNYKKAWESGGLKWLDIDITTLYKALGGSSGNHKYFSIFGHFKDPVKFGSHPIRSAQHKGSVVYRFFHEALTGVNWQGKRYTTFTEIAGLKNKGKKKGQTVTWDFAGGGPLSYEQLPSFILSQLKGWQPVQIQNLLAWLAGEMEGFDAVANSAGLGVRSTYEKKTKKRF